ncbi:DoxX family membrane protein [Streptomyces sp. NPDC058001]|uniref:DoxX family membrane protein n=1 Tax=Streptomyces sp. NPDC058001 TaxID=3346300 RepID=UPI0036EB488A
MSVDTRTPRTPTGDRSSGFDDAPALSMVKVPSDPAQVIVNHASFRVQLPTAPQTRSPRIARHQSAAQESARIPAAGAGRARRRAPVVWSGRSAPGDPGATGLLQAVRGSSVRHADGEPVGDGGATQVIPRIAFDDTVETPGLTEPYRAASPETRLLPAQMRSAGSAYDELPYETDQFDEFEDSYGLDQVGEEPTSRRHGADPVRHAYYPGRRMNLGVVLLPLRVFLGFISIYAGMGKLCDPVYFDGGERGSMVKWLNSLHPWALAEPLRDFALQHPVGAGLCIAFFQVIVGVLTVLGLWQRVAAVVGALLSAALILTVSWKTVPAYDAPDIIYLAAWSPLIIAGAPVYSVDGRLASEAWRTLGPRAELWELRRRVLRRGGLVAAVVVGVTLLIGSLLGGAVRDADRVTVPGPGESPRNQLPGSPLPQEPGRPDEGSQSPSASGTPTQGQQGGASAPPSKSASAPGDTARETAGATTAGQPSQTQGTAGQAPPQQTAPPQQAPATSAGPDTGGGSDGGTGSGGSTGGGTGGSGGSGGDSGRKPGLVGGLIGGGG